MGGSFIERIQAKIELFRLEQRYTRRRHRRSTFVSNAVYVDGEYVYNTPNTTGSSAATNTSKSSRVAGRLNRWSSVPGLASLSKSSPTVTTSPVETSREWSSSAR